MSLITCPECKNQVSDRAKSCPHCGAPVEIQAPHTVVSDPEPPGVKVSDAVQEKKSNGFGKVGIIMSILSLFFSTCVIVDEIISFLISGYSNSGHSNSGNVSFWIMMLFPLFVLALVFSIIGLFKQPKKTAVIGMILTGIAFIVMVLSISFPEILNHYNLAY